MTGGRAEADRDLLGAPLALVALLHAVTSGQWTLGVALALGAAGTVIVRRRFFLGGPGQALLALAGIGVAVVALQVMPPPDEISSMGARWTIFWSGAALTTLWIAIPRLYVARPLLGRNGTAAVTLVALIACGHRPGGPLYPTVAVAALLALLLALRRGDPGRPPRGEHTRRSIVVACGIIALAGVVTLGAARALPPLYFWTLKQMGGVFGARAGFSERFELSKLAGLMESDVTVLRLRGRHADHLRGAVYTRYHRGRWLPPRALPKRDARARAPDPPGGAATEVVPVGGDRRRFFVPLDARRLSTAEPLRWDATGILRPAAGQDTEPIRFVRGPRDRFALSGPAAGDLQLPTGAGAYRRLAADWSAGARTPRGKLAAIAGRLAKDYRYSLRTGKGTFEADPTLAFLKVHRRGHCEYFASAMALLARSAGIHARVIGGYRVLERNDLGGYYVVRERNAHAWVEAWLPGAGWQTFDPTPAAALARQMPARTPFLGALGDLLAHSLSRALAWFATWGPVRLTLTLGALIVLWIGVRRMMRRRGRPAPPERRYTPPLAGLLRLLEALAERGAVRSDSEPLERFAARLERDVDAPGDLRQNAAALINAYAALRYGGGDPAELSGELGRLTRRLRPGT